MESYLCYIAIFKFNDIVSLSISHKEGIELFLINDKGEPVKALLELAHLLKIKHDGTLQSLNDQFQTDWYHGGKLRKDIVEQHGQIDRQRAIELFRALGMVDEVAPSPGLYSYILVLGCAAWCVERRISFLLNKHITTRKLMLVGSERQLDDKEREFLRERKLNFVAVRPYLKVETSTEILMMLALLRRIGFPGPSEDIVEIVAPPDPFDNGRGSWIPNTGDTLRYWLRREPRIGTCLVVSSQPFISYQETIARKVLEPAGFQVFACGPQATEDLAITKYLDNIAKLCYEEAQILKNLQS